jgi:hypothetical protein
MVGRKTRDISVGSATPLRTCKLPLENPVKRQPFTLGNSAAPDMVDLDADLSVLS